jgi:hypothetical protein
MSSLTCENDLSNHGTQTRLALAFALGMLAATVGCAAHETVAAKPSTPPHPRPSKSWVIPPDRAESVLERGELELVSASGTDSGVTGASKVVLRSRADDMELAVKWKPVPGGLDGWNNSPRKELAAYRVQKLFLKPDDYVVPPTVMRCFEIESFKKVFPEAEPNLPGSSCVLGAMSLWLRDVRAERVELDRERFSRDPNYAYHFADFNMLTYLIAHKDGRASNFLVGGEEDDERVFSVDNGISFDPVVYNFFVPNWNDLRVPALARDAVERLRDVSEDQLEEEFGVLAELRVDEHGVYRPVAPGRNLDPDSGARRKDGIVQFGLTEDEIEDLEDRIEDLLDDVDDGKIALF